ncbi:MAG: ankyrin repeat domain-containing protein [Steroidobacteraceae bacterium]
MLLLASGFGTAANAGQGPALVAAIQANDLDQARQWLKEPNVAEADGTTALHWAADNANLKAVRLLLKAGADVNASNRYGVTPLSLAVTSGDAAVVKALLDAGADVNKALVEGETVLMTAARTGNAKVVRALIARGADLEARESFYGETALITAVSENHAETVAALLDAGAGVNVRSKPTEFVRERFGLSILPKGNWTALMYASRDGSFEAAKVLVEHGADLNLTDPDGTTALVFAIINYHYDLAAMLVQHGADPNVADTTGMNALFAAVDMKTLPWTFGRPEQKGSSKVSAAELIDLLLDRGANPNARLTKPLLMRAHTDGDPAVGPGATAYMRAAKAGDVQTMKRLVERGADPNATMNNGDTALMLAAGLGWRDGNMAVPSRDVGTEEEAMAAIQFCLDRGADINAAGGKKNTALHVASTGRGSMKIVEFLHQHGASLDALNEAGQTPRDAAVASRFRDRTAVAKLLASLKQ